MRKILFAVAIIVAVILIALTVNYFRNKPATGEVSVTSNNQAFKADNFAGDVQPTPNPTDTTAVENIDYSQVTTWSFNGFTGEVDVRSGYKYKWANFVSPSGQTVLEAICTMPPNPAPVVGDQFFLDPRTGILLSAKEYRIQDGIVIPSGDFGKNATQRFWPRAKWNGN